MILRIKRKGNNTVWCRILYESLLFQKLKECSKRHHCILLLSEEKNSFHLEFLFHHNKIFQANFWKRDTRLSTPFKQLVSTFPCGAKVLLHYCAFLCCLLFLKSIISFGQCPAKNKCSAILEKENNIRLKRLSLSEKSRVSVC